MTSGFSRGIRRSVQIAALVAITVVGGTGCMIYPKLPARISNVSIDVVDDANVPLDGVEVRVVRYGAPVFIYLYILQGPDQELAPGKVEFDPPRMMDRHFDYACPWGSERIQVNFSKPGYMEASREYYESLKSGSQTVVQQVVLHKKN